MARKRIEENLAYDDGKRRYYAYFDCGTDPQGRRVRKSRMFATRQEARQALDEFARQREGDGPNAGCMTLGDWLAYWLEDVVRPNLASTTCYCYQCIIKNHIAPALGQIPLADLTAQRIQQYYARMMREKGLSGNSVHKHHILLHTALKLACRQRMLAENPLDWVTPPRQRPPRQLYYTPEQLRTLFQLTRGTGLELVVKLGGYLGLRRGEICGLRWENVDLERRIIRIRSVRTTAGGTVVEKCPKTPTSIRELGIAGLVDLEQLLRRTRQEQMDRTRAAGELWKESGYVLARADRSPWHPNQVTWTLEKFVRKNGLPPISVHGLRHTFASLANSAHIPLVDIGKALGHKDISITGRIYTHLFDQTHNEVLCAVADRIGEG